MRFKSIVLVAVAAQAAWAQSADLAAVVSKPLSRTVELPGEILPWMSVALHARVAGYVERVEVDRGSAVKKGQLLVEMSAPEMKTRIAEADARVQAADSGRLQAEAQLAAAQSTVDLLAKAAETPGAVAGGELIQARKLVAAAEALVQSRAQERKAAEAAAQAAREMATYLRVEAPFDGVVTERLVHPGALAGPGPDQVLMTIEQISRLRLVVPVPEEDAGAAASGAVSFRVPAFPGRTFSGAVARRAHSLDPKTRTMPVELDVANGDSALSPGMYAKVNWPVRRARPSLFVPKTSVVTTTERTFVIRARDGKAQWVDVKKGVADEDLIEVSGDLQAGDKVVRRATDELREGAALGGK